MTAISLQRLQYLTAVIPSLLMQIPEKDFFTKPAPDKWSKKEILGHLIDSAANNHQRFIRAQFEDNPAITYDQNNWNTFSYHQQTSPTQLIAFWTAYNKQLATIIEHISEENLNNTVNVNGKNLPLSFLIKDYVEHMEHHLKQIVSY